MTGISTKRSHMDVLPYSGLRVEETPIEIEIETEIEAEIETEIEMVKMVSPLEVFPWF
jgi:hypothetical protein